MPDTYQRRISQRDAVEQGAAAQPISDLSRHFGVAGGKQPQSQRTRSNRVAACADAEVIDGDHDEAGIGKVLTEAIPAMAVDVDVPIVLVIGTTGET